MAGEVDLIEKLIAGSVGTTAVLGVAAYVLWARLNSREKDHSDAMERKDGLITTMVDRMTTAMAGLERAVTQNTNATESLREAIEHNDSRRTKAVHERAERAAGRD